MPNAPAQQSSSPNEEADYLAQMEQLIVLHDDEGWNDEARRGAKKLLGEWLELPTGVDDDDDDYKDSYQIPDTADRFWDLCDAEAEAQRQREIDDAVKPRLCPLQWMNEVEPLLEKHWGDP